MKTSIKKAKEAHPRLDQPMPLNVSRSLRVHHLVERLTDRSFFSWRPGSSGERCILHGTCQRSAQARQRAVEVGLHRRLRHMEGTPNFREGHLPETVQEDDRTKLRGQGIYSRMQYPLQLNVLGHLFRQRLAIGNGLEW